MQETLFAGQTSREGFLFLPNRQRGEQINHLLPHLQLYCIPDVFLP